MDVETSMDRFGTVYLSTEFMEKIIDIGDDTVQLTDWISFLPSRHRSEAIAVLKEVSAELWNVECRVLFKARLIQNIQDRMLQLDEERRVNKKPWWYPLMKSRRGAP